MVRTVPPAHDGAMNASPQTTDGSATRTRMERPRAGRVLAGVSAAIAIHTGIPTWLVRLTFVVTSLLGGLGVLLYAAGWMLIPSEGDERTPAERWLGEVDTPSSRVGVLLIGLAVVVASTWLFPFGVVAVVALLVAGLFLVQDAQASDGPKEESCE